MTVMTPAEAREEKHYDQVAHLIPDWESRARAMMEDFSIPQEFEGHGFESKADVAEKIEKRTVEVIREARMAVPHDAVHFVEDEVEMAKDQVYQLVMEEFEEYAGDEIDL
ncbi:hypothetical protein HLRTI_002894 [Halorhabdus tiamatea SARL4B]|uniref:Uncharacterized protein n=1 Tax=Halorhabdus tiamatea SARL4B TaxID=1033806 RepID=U2F433_9EURY|nr:hypothetical protein [Halorhabdus tiamatea]ERJ05095.1 hypothetical protein HLRTI_002894 [Halorhabdus tiamatea SARL4B]